MNTTDVAVIGAGPIGLFAIFECGIMGLKVHIFDSLPYIGGQCTALYPEKPIYDIPAIPKINGYDLIQNLKKQAEPFLPMYHLGEQVIDLCYNTNGWVVRGNKGTLVEVKAVLIAAGLGSFGPNRPPLKGIESFETRCVHYSVLDKSLYKNKKIVIAGGGDSAIDWVLELSLVAAHITLVHRRNHFKASPGTLSQLEALQKKGILSILTPFQLHAIHGVDGQMQFLEIISLEGQTQTLEADFLLPFFGMKMDLGPINHWGLNLDHGYIVIDPKTCQTNAQGIYAIGDIATYPSKKKLILCGFAEAAHAAFAIREYIYPDKTFHFEHSTTRGVPGA